MKMGNQIQYNQPFRGNVREWRGDCFKCINPTGSHLAVDYHIYENIKTPRMIQNEIIQKFSKLLLTISRNVSWIFFEVILEMFNVKVNQVYQIKWHASAALYLGVVFGFHYTHVGLRLLRRESALIFSSNFKSHKPKTQRVASANQRIPNSLRMMKIVEA